MLHAGGRDEHRTFAELDTLLRAGDVLVLNETRVVPARLRATRRGGGAAEVLLLRPRAGPFDWAAREWVALVRPGARLRPGATLHFAGGVEAEVVETLPDGPRILRFPASADLATLAAEHGEVPLPPYVGPGDAARAERYQTVFARVPGSVAAPTASLHFTPELLARLEGAGVELRRLVLDVGIGTFRPMSGETIDEHVMHAERYDVPAETAAAIAAAKAEGRRVVAAGTTVLRALEAAGAGGLVRAGPAETDLFVRPGYAFQVVDALVTNFHLPRSTLLVLVAAFAGYERIRAAYETAIARRYRFFSFGDAMLIERRRITT